VYKRHHEEASRHAWSAWGTRNAGFSTAFLRSSSSAWKLHSGCESVMHIWHRRYVFCCVNSVLHLNELRVSTSPEACTSTWSSHEEPSLRKKARMARAWLLIQLVLILTTGTWWQPYQRWSLISNCYRITKRTDTLEYQRSANPARRTKNNVNAPSIISHNTDYIGLLPSSSNWDF